MRSLDTDSEDMPGHRAHRGAPSARNRTRLLGALTSQLSAPHTGEYLLVTAASNVRVTPFSMNARQVNVSGCIVPRALCQPALLFSRLKNLIAPTPGYAGISHVR
eukprot:5903219-Pyramimonas_sp.AAC.2